MTDAKIGLDPAWNEHFAPVKGVRMRYFTVGEGPPVVLIHGFGGTAANWVEVAPRLAGSHRLMLPDLPGHGGSSALPAAAGTAGFAERVAGVLDRESASPAVVVGHSMGALVALSLALRRPGAVAGLVLAGAAGLSWVSPRRRALLALDAVVRPARVPARFVDAIARTPALRRPVFGWWGASDPPALSPDAVAGLLVGPPQHTDLRTAAAALGAGDPRPDLDRIACPVLVLWGARDHQTPVANGFEYARRLRAELRVIPDCGHLLIAERPDACAHAIADLAGRVAAG